MTIELPNLPYKLDALEPHISKRTLEFHYGKHHAGYVKKLNKAIEKTDYAGQDLESIIKRAHAASDSGVFNNAAQVWNHDFLWHSMSPSGGGEPEGNLADAISDEYRGFDKFAKEFKNAATGQFGSGWAWLVSKAGRLEILSTGNADTPVTDAGATPILTLDVWEHAYYLDYQNKRGDYVDMFLKELINWEFAAENFDSVRAAA